MDGGFAARWPLCPGTRAEGADPPESSLGRAERVPCRGTDRAWGPRRLWWCGSALSSLPAPTLWTAGAGAGGSVGCWVCRAAGHGGRGLATPGRVCVAMGCPIRDWEAPTGSTQWGRVGASHGGAGASTPRCHGVASPQLSSLRRGLMGCELVGTWANVAGRRAGHSGARPLGSALSTGHLEKQGCLRPGPSSSRGAGCPPPRLRRAQRSGSHSWRGSSPNETGSFSGVLPPSSAKASEPPRDCACADSNPLT